MTVVSVGAAFRQESREKSKRKAEQVKKRKAEEAVRHNVYEGTDQEIGEGLQEGLPADGGIPAEPGRAHLLPRFDSLPARDAPFHLVT